MGTRRLFRTQPTPHGFDVYKMASSNPTSSQCSQRNRIYQLKEVLELIQTEGSDVEESAEDSDYSPNNSASDYTDSEGDVDASEEEGVGEGGETESETEISIMLQK